MYVQNIGLDGIWNSIFVIFYFNMEKGNMNKKKKKKLRNFCLKYIEKWI